LEEYKSKDSPIEKLTKIAKSLKGEDPTKDKQENNPDYNNIINDVLRIVRDWYHIRAQDKLDREIQRIFDEIIRLVGLQFITEHINSDTKLLTMDNQEVKSLLADIPREIVKSILAQLIKEQNMIFPYKKFFELPPDQLFTNLQQYKPIITNKPFSPNACKIFSKDLFPFTFNGKYTVLSNVDENYNTIDVIADHFTEEQRMKAVRADQTSSPMDYWKYNTIRVNIIVV